MRVLVVGGGGREHAIVWKLSQSPHVDEVFCAPGNGGIAELATIRNIKATDIPAMVEYAKEIRADMVVVAPDDPLVLGMVDEMEKAGFPTFGPRANAAILEGSKVFSKELMRKYHIPTAKYQVFDDPQKAVEYVKTEGAPIVIKAEGLALGKGVVVAETVEQAIEAIGYAMVDKKFGAAGNRVVVEECLSGPEVSVLAFADGKTLKPMVAAQDHKRAYDQDKGPNTGGMGTFSPSRIYTKELAKQCEETIFYPTMQALMQEGRPFQGVLYFGLMITRDGPKVIEYNARFGDPEAQVVLPRLESDLYEVFQACIQGKLDSYEIKWGDNAAVCVVLASGGYPLAYQKGFEITGLQAAKDAGFLLFHAGTKLENNKTVTSGGRVLGVTALGDDLDDAIRRAYEGVNLVHFEDEYYRSDIGVK